MQTTDDWKHLIFLIVHGSMLSYYQFTAMICFIILGSFQKVEPVSQIHVPMKVITSMNQMSLAGVNWLTFLELVWLYCCSLKSCNKKLQG